VRTPACKEKVRRHRHRRSNGDIAVDKGHQILSVCLPWMASGFVAEGEGMGAALISRSLSATRLKFKQVFKQERSQLP
jgi:hypothetical protein